MKQDRSGAGFDRYLRTIDIWALAFGCMVGWGAFVMPGTTFIPMAGPLGTLIAMGIGTAIMLLIGANFSFLMVHSPGTGGIYSYTKNALGRDHAFLCSWFICLSYLTIVFLNSTALFIVVRIIFGDRLKSGYHYSIAGNDIYLKEVGVSIAALVIIGILFITAKSFLQNLLTILSVILLAGIIVIAVICIPHAISGNGFFSFGSTGVSPGYAVFSIVILAPWALVGFDVISFDTAHFKVRKRSIKWIVFISILTAGFAYIAMSAVSVAAVPDGYLSWREYMADLNVLDGVTAVPTFYAAGEIMGKWGLVITTITAFAAILTGIIGAYRAIVRVLSTMAEDRIVSEKFSATTYSILFIMIISVAVSFLGRNVLNWFVELTSFGAVVAFGYTSVSCLKIARSMKKSKVMVSGVIGTVITVSFTIVHLVPKITALEVMGSESFFLLSLWCLLGFIFYLRTIRSSNMSEYSGMSISGIVLFSLLLYSALMWFIKNIVSNRNIQDIHSTINITGVILLIIIFAGLAVMLYVQNLLRKKHEELEREKIRAVESSLAKSQFLFNMSHDIRTPMNAISGYTSLALKEDMSPELKDYLTKIDSSSKHLLELINDILEMSRIESGHTELEYIPSDLNLILDEIKDMFSQQMKEKQLNFSVYTSQLKHPYVWCDKKNLNRILLNLVSNAYKFTPEGGTVSVVLYETGSPQDDRASYELRIKDNGIGMSKEFSEKMFNAFERERTSTVSKVQGTGLGLAITKSIIDLMDGTIDVITSPGDGTEIIIRLKFKLCDSSQLEPDTEADDEKKDEKADLAGKRVLLVEDNDINREIAVMILSQEGLAVETAVNGKIAVDMVAASESGYYDAVLMDIQMPVMNGYEATKAIRSLENKDLADIPILAMTANAFKEDEDAAFAAGMQAHIAKPLDIDKMFETLSKVLTGK